MEGKSAIFKRRKLSINANPSNGGSPSRDIHSMERSANNTPGNFGHDRMNQSITEFSSSYYSGFNLCPVLQKLKIKDNCWLCEGWSEYRF